MQAGLVIDRFETTDFAKAGFIDVVGKMLDIGDLVHVQAVFDGPLNHKGKFSDRTASVKALRDFMAEGNIRCGSTYAELCAAPTGAQRRWLGERLKLSRKQGEFFAITAEHRDGEWWEWVADPLRETPGVILGSLMDFYAALDS